MKTTRPSIAFLLCTMLCTAVGVASAQNAGDTASELDTVLGRAQAYVMDYERALGMIIGEEEYVQEAVWRDGRRQVADRERRRLTSDFLLLPVGSRWYGVRTVLRVDGREVEVSDDVGTDLVDSTDAILASVSANARYNIGDFVRTFNVPTFALSILRPTYFPRFSFEKDGEGRVAGADAWEIRFTEVTGPTLVRGGDGGDRPARGMLWVSPDTGEVLQTEMIFEGDAAGTSYQARMRVAYERNTTLGMLVPGVMDEQYDSAYHSVETRADYFNFQRFSVVVDVETGTR